MNKKNKKGISLIVLVITIIVIIILAAAVILTLTGNNPIENAKQAAYINDIASFQDELDMYKANEYAKSLGNFDPATLNASSENTALLFTYIPSLEGKTKYIAELSVVAGGLIYTGPTDSVHKDWAAIANVAEGTAPVIPVTDTISPTVTFGTNGGANATQVSTTVTVTDASGVNASTLQYIWDTQNTTEPTGVWTAFVSGDNLTKTGTGIYYLWVKASDTAGNNIVTKSNVFGVGDVEIPVGTIQTEHKTFAGATSGWAYNNPVIPAGFVAVNKTNASWNNLATDYNNGLVIQDASGNQFVWVPVDGTAVKYEKWCTSGFPHSSTADDILPTGVTSETTQIDTYKGFYIARFEAGKDGTTLVSKKGATVWGLINYTDSKAKAQAMYTSTNVKSGLLTGKMWDTTMKWIQNSGKSVTDSRAWGNHSNSISPANISGYGALQVTGYSDYWQAKNIYNLAGNVFEWTNEIEMLYSYYDVRRVRRGGVYSGSGTIGAADFRGGSYVSDALANISFRVSLYIL